MNHEWVFRFPKSGDVERRFPLENRMLTALSRETPTALPAFCFFGKPSSEFPRHFVGYPKLPGVPGIHVDPTHMPWPALAQTLARFLSRLHAFPLAEAADLGVECHEIRSHIEETRAEALADFHHVCSVAPEAPLDAWCAYLKDGPDLIGASASRPALVHNDLAAEHILVDPMTKTVTGIIDWSDVAVGDPAVDFAGIFHWGGKAFFDAVLSTYDGLIDEFLRARARFLAACRSVGDVVFGLGTDRREYLVAGLRALEFRVPEV